MDEKDDETEIYSIYEKSKGTLLLEKGYKGVFDSLSGEKQILQKWQRDINNIVHCFV